MFRRPAQLAAEAAFGAAGYGLPIQGSPETVRGLVETDVRDWHRDHVGQRSHDCRRCWRRRPGRRTRGAGGRAGGIGPARGGCAGADTGVVVQRRSHPDRGSGEETDRARDAVPGADPSFARSRFAAEVWAAHVGGLGGRLFEALRDQRSLAYTVAAWPWQRRRVGALVTYIATTPAREAGGAGRDAGGAGRAPRSRRRGDAEIGRSARYLAGQAEVSRQRGGLGAR